MYLSGIKGNGKRTDCLQGSKKKALDECEEGKFEFFLNAIETELRYLISTDPSHLYRDEID